MKKSRLFFYVLAIIFFAFNTNTVVKAEESVNTYDGELGIAYTSSGTRFNVWSSSAASIKVVIDGVEESLTKNSTTNLWTAYVGGDLLNRTYTYTVDYGNGEVYENVLDPYGKYFNSTYDKNIIYEGSLAGFDSWYEQEGNVSVENKSQFIYGLNVENYTKSSTWNGTVTNQGKLLGLIEEGTKYSGLPTGFDYIRTLGVTHIELTDVMDDTNKFAINRNIITGEYSYSGNLELKNVVNQYYQSGVGVIASITLDTFTSDFLQNLHKLDKNYYLNEDSTLNIDREMVQKYIKDLAMYWANEYKLAGLKFEDMNVIDLDVINEISSSLKANYQDILLYGDGSYTTVNTNKSGENNLANITYVNMVNNSLNYALYGNLHNLSTNGLLAGNYSAEMIETLKFALFSTVNNGVIDYSLVQGVSYKGDWNNDSAYRLVNNFGEKDGLSLYDKLYLSNIVSDSIIKHKTILALGTLVSSGGIPYVYAGNEFLMSYVDSSKNANGNSICDLQNNFCFYKDESQKTIDWSYAYKYNDIISAFKSLINFRNSTNSVAQYDRETIIKSVRFYSNENYQGVLGFTRTYIGVRVNQTEKLSVIFNYSNHDYNITDIEGKSWQGLYNYNNSLRDGDEVNMYANSIFMEVRIKQRKVSQWVTLIFVVGIIGLVYALNLFLNKKLVERGHDIKDVRRKYRPFIKNTMNQEKNSENIDQSVVNEEEIEQEQQIDDEDTNKKDNN